MSNCQAEKDAADEAADELWDAMDKQADYENDLADSFSDLMDADTDFWNSIGSDDPDAAPDAYDAYKFAEEKAENDFEAYNDARADAAQAYSDWIDSYNDYCDCMQG